MLHHGLFVLNMCSVCRQAVHYFHLNTQVVVQDVVVHTLLLPHSLCDTGPHLISILDCDLNFNREDMKVVQSDVSQQ